MNDVPPRPESFTSFYSVAGCHKRQRTKRQSTAVSPPYMSTNWCRATLVPSSTSSPSLKLWRTSHSYGRSSTLASLIGALDPFTMQATPDIGNGGVFDVFGVFLVEVSWAGSLHFSTLKSALTPQHHSRRLAIRSCTPSSLHQIVTCIIRQVPTPCNATLITVCHNQYRRFTKSVVISSHQQASDDIRMYRHDARNTAYESYQGRDQRPK